MHSGSESEYLNVRETARMLQVHENTVRNWAANGVLTSAKLPGARAHRFARTEVERLQRDRGAATSSAARPLRQDGPELVGPFDLDGWAARDDAKTAFPELMDRLLSATPGVTNISIRSHEGTAAHGWDATASSDGSSFLPKGKLHFEFGTNEDPKRKANEDYDHREGKTEKASEVTFAFATPKNWPGGAKWATDKSALGEYASVEAYDAHRLASWIRTIPSVHYWISERLGYSPRDAETLSNWYSDFQDSLTIKLSGAFFTSGRDSAAKSLVGRLTAADAVVVAVQASNLQEALAFAYGALETSDLLPSVLVVHKREAWDRLVGSLVPSILIPTFEIAPVAKALKNQHRVILLAGSADLIASGDIKLPRIDPLAASEALGKVSKHFNENQKAVALARRNMPAYLRSISQDKRLPKPTWATDPSRAGLLSRLALISTWSATEADQEIVARVAGASWPDVERALKSLEREGTPVYVPSGSSWQLGAPKEAARLLFDQLISADIDAWGDVVRDVLLAINPYLGMTYSARIQAQIDDVRPKYSSELRRGLALSLALANWCGATTDSEGMLGAAAPRILRTIWSAASKDGTGQLWASLTDEMPLLAEAAPIEFLNAVEADLDSKQPLLPTLFQDQASDSPFGASSPHTGLLWALETLAWAPEHFHRAAEMLARLAGVDPGGKLSNRPAQSFIDVMLGWIRQSGATVDEKLDLLESLTRAMPDTMWPLLIGLLPQSHGFSIPPHTPTYQEWASESTGVPIPDWVRYVRGVLSLATGMAAGNSSRWARIVDKYEELPPDDRSQLLTTIAEDRKASNWSADEMYELWQTLDEKIRRHEEFPSADWALKSDELTKLKAAAALVASSSDPRRYIALFDWRVQFNGKKYGDEGFDEELGEAQIDALEQVAKDGLEAIKALAGSVKNTNALGWQLAAIGSADSLDEEVIKWLTSPRDDLRNVARGFVQNRIRRGSWEWIETVYPIAAELDDQAKRLFASTIPFTREYWTKLEDSGPALLDAFWSQGRFYVAEPNEYIEAVEKLLGANHPWAAVEVISNYMHPNKTPDLEIVKKALAGLIKTSEPMPDSSMSPYYVEQLLSFMEQNVPDDPDLASYEFALFGLLHDKNPTFALYRSLNADPQDFILMIRALFRGENEEKREVTAAAKRFANRAWEILREWTNIPGQQPDGSIDSEKVKEWVQAARFAFEESGHTSAGDEQIGEILSASPLGADGIWPAEAVRELVEATASVRLETGLQIGLFNRRGVTSRSPYEGGAQERALQEKYHAMSIALAPKWRRTSRMLAAIAKSYGHDARREDEDAERQADRE